MSGLNSQQKRLKKQTSAILIIYFIVILLICFTTINIPKYFNAKMDSKVVEIKDELKNQLGESAALVNEVNLENTANKYPMQLVIKKGSEVIYSNMSISDTQILDKNTNNDSVFYKSNYQDNGYDIWLLLYNESVSVVYSYFTTFFIVVFSIVMLLTLIIVRVQFNTMFVPLKGVYNNIQKMKKHKLNSDYDKMDVLTKELKDFVDDIQDRVEEYKVVYSDLEKQLLEKDAQNDIKKTTVSSLVHDIKTPLNIISLSTELLKRNIASGSENIEDIDKSTDEINADIQSILEILHSDNFKTKKEEVNLVDEIKANVKQFKKLLAKKDVVLDINLLPDAIVFADSLELKSILNNIFSNINNYAKEATDVIVNLAKKDDKYILKIINHVNNIEDVDFENALNLFKSKSEKKNSSGVGLFIVDNFAKRNNIKYKFFRENDGVVNYLEFQIDGESDV